MLTTGRRAGGGVWADACDVRLESAATSKLPITLRTTTFPH